jgi:hypothetical protein
VVAIFHAEGAPLLTGTDSLNPYNVQGDSLHQELDNFVRAGMRPYQALRCATAEAARFVGQSESWGTLAVGKWADLLILRTNPLRNVRAVRDLEAVVVNGYYLTRPELDRLLERRAALVSGPPRLPTTDLPPLQGLGAVVDEGVWTERILGAEFGRISYRHRRLPDGGWLIEERQAGANPRRHLERRTARLTLTPNLTVKAGEQEVEAFVGTATNRITWSAASGYTVASRAVDGWESHSTLPGPRLAPGERLAFSLVPSLIGQLAERGPGASVATLELEGGSATSVRLTLAVADGEGQAAPPGEARWRLQIDRPAEPTEQTYRLDPAGRLLGMDELLPLLWPRELVPISEPDVSQARSSALYT